MAWFVVEDELEFLDEQSGRGTAMVRSSDGRVEIAICAYFEFSGRRAVLSRLDVQGSGPNQVGARIGSLATWVKAYLDVDELRIEGATRTSLAGPGRDPSPIVF